jgi:hypothetical protein
LITFAETSLAEIKTTIRRLSFEERAALATWLHGWKGDEWDEQMERDIPADSNRQRDNSCFGCGIKRRHI